MKFLALELCYILSAEHLLIKLFDVVADQTIHSSEKRNSNSGGMSKDTRLKLDKSVPVSGTTQGIANELKYTLTCGREKQMNPFTGEVKITSGARMEDACFTLKLEAWKSETGM
jgi:hypothetical protein